MIEVGLLALQGASLAGISALLVSLWHRQRAVAARPPHHFDHDLSRGPVVSLGGWGQATVDGAGPEAPIPGDRLTLQPALDGVRIYEVWALTWAGWVQLLPDGPNAWTSPLLAGAPVRGLRLWVDLAGEAPPDTRPARSAAPMLVPAALVLAGAARSSTVEAAQYEALPTASPEPPVGSRRSMPTPSSRHEIAMRWADGRMRDVLVGGLLEEWTEACTAASRVGWVTGIPAGDAVLTAWARSPAVGEGDLAVSFARWLVGELGKATRLEPLERTTVERREPVARLLFMAAARLLRGLDESLELDATPPRAVGARHQEAWLVDEDTANALDNAPVNGLVQPVVVLRPALRHRGAVLLEGEVA